MKKLALSKNQFKELIRDAQSVNAIRSKLDKVKAIFMDERFNLDHQYSLYLERVNLKEENMHPVQRIETKRAWMGAVGQMLVLFRDDITEFPEEMGVIIMQSLWDQTAQYWEQEAKDYLTPQNPGSNLNE